MCSTHTIVCSLLGLSRVPSPTPTCPLTVTSGAPLSMFCFRIYCYIFHFTPCYLWGLYMCVSFGHTTSRGTSPFDTRLLSLPELRIFISLRAFNKLLLQALSPYGNRIAPKKKMAPCALSEGNQRSGAKLLNVRDTCPARYTKYVPWHHARARNITFALQLQSSCSKR